MADSTNSIEPNAFLSLLTNAINPDQFYENMTYLSGVAAITPWLFVVIMVWLWLAARANSDRERCRVESLQSS